jgi:outer membrane protein assembly factor BamB
MLEGVRKLAALAVTAALALTTVALAADALAPVKVARPIFAPAIGSVKPSGPVRLALVSSRYKAPALSAGGIIVLQGGPTTYQGVPLAAVVRQPAVVLLIYGRDGLTARYVVGASPSGTLRYAFDFSRFWRSPGGGMPQQVAWARQVGGVLYVETTHLGYASTSKGRNAYLTAIEISSGRLLWRTPGLVANAGTFEVIGNLIVTGYGFTAEPDFLYLIDRRTGHVRDRLAVPSGPERIVLKDGRLKVRTYDHELIVKLVPAP